MEAKAGTRVKAMTIKEGRVVDCRNWLEFAIVKHLYNGDRVRYREIDTDPKSGVESGCETERAH